MTEPVVEPIRLAGAPGCLCHTGSPERAAVCGTLLLYHGLGVDALSVLPEARRLAAAGYLVVAVDNVAHGRRHDPAVQAQLHGADREPAFFRVVHDTVQEVPAVLDALAGRGWLRWAGLAGVSLGAHIVYGAVCREPRIRAALALLGNPCWGKAPDSPHRQLDAFATVGLLSVVAARDQVVPPHGARTFHARLAARYPDAGSRLLLREYPESGHTMAPGDWEDAWALALAWLRERSPAPPGGGMIDDTDGNSGMMVE